MKLDWIKWGVVGVVLSGCADKSDIRARLDASDVVGDVSTDAQGDVGSDSAPPSDSATASDTGADSGPEVSDTTSDVTSPGDVDSSEVAETTTSDTSPDTNDTVTPNWEVDPDAPWALGRPILISGTEGAAEMAAPVLAGGRYSVLVPVRIGSGAVVADGRTFAAPDAGGHAALAALSGDLLGPQLATVVYLDGPLSGPALPSLAVCDGAIYATINEQNGQSARLVRLSADLETIDSALFGALPGIGHSVKLGAPLCGGPGFVATLDAVGGASFTAPNATKSEFNATQTENKTLILNGTRVFAENAAQIVSAASMRILSVTAGPAQEIFYVGEATMQRQIGETTLMPGDQLVYNHDYATGTGGSIASQGWFGKEDISLLATAADGRFAVVWVDVTPGAMPTDPELVEVVVSVFQADGARAWNKRSSAWAIDRVSFDASGDLRIAGRFRSLEAIGVATAPIGLEDVFLAVLAGNDGARLRHVVLGVPGLGTSLVGPIFDAVGSGECVAVGALDAVLAVTGPTRVGIGVAADNARCATQALTASDGQLMLTLAPVADDAQDAVNFWLSLAGPALGGAHGTPWPAGGALVGPLRARFVSPL